MDELSILILSHTVIGMEKRLTGPDTVLCLCGESMEGMSAQSLHAEHLAKKLTEAGYAKPLRVRKFEVGDRVETYKHDTGEVMGWSMHSSGGVTYQVFISNRGSYTYSEKDLQKA